MCLSVSILVPAIPVCRNCGMIAKYRTPSCCARRGDWFNKCGDPGDSRFEHTWFEGIQICASKFIRKSETYYLKCGMYRYRVINLTGLLTPSIYHQCISCNEFISASAETSEIPTAVSSSSRFRASPTAITTVGKFDSRANLC